MTENDGSYEFLLRKVSFRLLPFMFVLYIISYLDRINISFAGAPMCSELNFNSEVFGFGSGIFFLGYCLCGVPSNLVMQRVGARRWISFIMIIWGIVSVLLAFVPNSSSFFWMRFFLGVAESGFFPGMIFYLTRWFPKREHGLAVAKFMSAVPAAGIIGALLASKILAMPPILNLSSWKWLFIITGSPAIVFGFLVLLYLPDGPQQATWLTEGEKVLLQSRLEVSTSNEADNLWTTMHDARIWILALLYFSLTLGMYGFQLWLPQIVDAVSHGGAAHTALLTIIPAVFQALGMVTVARHSDQAGERRWHLACSALLAALGLLFASFLHSPIALLVSLCVTAFGIWGSVGPFWALPTGFLSGGAAATAIALINSMGNLGGFAGPYLVGAIKNRSPDFGSSLLFMSVSLTLGGLLALSLKPNSKA